MSLHVLSGSHHFIDEEELLGEDWSNVQELTLHDVVIPHVGGVSWQWVAGHGVDTVWFLVFQVSLLNFKEGILSVKTGILRQSSWDDQESFS